MRVAFGCGAELAIYSIKVSVTQSQSFSYCSTDTTVLEAINSMTTT